MRSTILSMVLLSAVFTVAVSAQELPTSSDPPRVEESASDYELGPGDVLSIRVSGLREFEQAARVSNSGRIHVPYVGVMLVAGMTAVEVEQDIARLIKEHELINEPSVRVQIEQHRARPTYVIGDVNAPGQFVITGDMYLLDLLSKAGGLQATADDRGFLYRRYAPRPNVQTRIFDDEAAESSNTGASPPAPLGNGRQMPSEFKAEDVIPIDFVSLREGTNPQLNLKLQGGDILYVPRRLQQNFYVIGDVKVPGAYGLPRLGEVTAAQAIIYAGGPLATASMGKAFLMRHGESGEQQALPVDFAAIIEGKKPDFPIRPNDIIFIPNSPVKTIGAGLLIMVPTIVQQWLIF